MGRRSVKWKLSLEVAILVGAGLIALSIAVTNHWQLEMGGPTRFLVFRLDRWTGKVTVCVPSLAGASQARGQFADACN